MKVKSFVVSASHATYIRNHGTDSKLYQYLENAEQLKEYSGKVYLEGCFYKHNDWPNIDKIITERAKNGVVQVIKI